jgi:hypothetical protein
MTPRRWQIVGGYVVGALYMLIAWNDFNFAWSPTAILVSLAVCAVGNFIGSWTVRYWQEAGR